MNCEIDYTRDVSFSGNNVFKKIHSKKFCAGYTAILTIKNTMKTTEDCFNWAK